MTGRLAAQVGPWFGPGLPDLPVRRGPTRITDDPMTLEVGNPILATAWFSKHATVHGNGV